MPELDAILETWRGLSGPAANAVLATVVHVTGSAYRRPGARMLLVPDGRRVGCVSGGCLEGDVSRKAWWWTQSGEPALRVYDTTTDEDAAWEFGLGCNGAVQVLLERVSAPGTAEMLEFLSAQRSARQAAVVATVVRAGGGTGLRIGDRLLANSGGTVGGVLAGTERGSELAAAAESAMNAGTSRLLQLDGAEIFVEFIAAPVSIVVLGAGHDAIPLVATAAELGWDVTVADGRPAYADASRFPGARSVVVMPAGDPLRDVEIRENCAVVMMTHNYPLDQRLLSAVVARRPRYLGILGPKTRTERLFSELTLETPAGLHAPIGLDLGSDTPQGIALAIIAEILAVTNGRAGAKLQNRNAPIHVPALVMGAVSGLETRGEKPDYCETVSGSNV